jgi:glutathione S-transferase
MKLIGAITSPYVRKVRIVLAEKKLDYEFVTEDVWAADTRIAESNPLGKVPCLIMDGQEAMFDSRVIVEYLALADGLLDAAILARLEATWPGRTENQRSQAWIDRQMGKVNDSLAAMSRGLGDKAFCSGVFMSLSDIAVGCALGYLDFRFPQLDWRSRHPNLHKLMDKLMQRQSFIDSAPPAA